MRAFWMANAGDLSMPALAAALAISLRWMMFCSACCSAALRVLLSGALKPASSAWSSCTVTSSLPTRAATWPVGALA